MSRNLLLTFGHNSSAVLVEDGKIVCGYEEERLSKVKSDSAFPRLAIMQCLNYKYIPSLDTVYISYWNDSFDIFNGQCTFNDKHYDRKFLKTLCSQYGAKLKYLSEDFTHHDAHAYAALNFFENHATEDEKKEDFTVIVSDGFGNREEVLSIYKRKDNKLEKMFMLQGYEFSMGLMYQYATSFCGMKENEDEYKFLGYESHIDEVLTNKQIEDLYEYSDKFIEARFNESWRNGKQDHPWTDYIDVTKLINVKNYWTKEYDKVLGLMGMSRGTDDPEKIRCVIAAFIQNNIQKFVKKYAKAFNAENLILSGGIFYNVKLNNYLMNNIDGKICVYPLAGDQGAAFGMQRFYEGQFEMKNLFFGKRDLRLPAYGQSAMSDSVRDAVAEDKLPRFKYFADKDEFVKEVIELIEKNQIVNIVTGDMEFGPRALGATTTMALPTKENVSYINKLNKRNDVMPMAPQILKSNASKYFGRQPDRIIGSNFYMIITMDQEKTPDASYIGISHKYPLKNIYSSRCQIVDDQSNLYSARVLKALYMSGNDFCINTSNNAHGRPILFSILDAVRNHEFTLKNDDENRSWTIIGAF